MKRILFIAPEAFPVMSSESICNSKVAYALAEAGYKVDVFTCNERDTYPADNIVDSFLRNHTNLRVFSVENARILVSSTYSFSKLLKNALINLGLLIKTGYWYNGISIPYAIYRAVEKQVKIDGGFSYDVIITRANNCDLAAIKLKKKYGVFWNANWNDPFPDRKFPAPYGAGPDSKLPFFEHRIYQRIQKDVDLHTFPSDRLRKYQLKCFPLITEDKTMVIPHMAHSAIYTLIKDTKLNDGVFRMVHCGSVGRPRDPEIFLKALSVVAKETRLKDNEFKCYFVGRYDKNLDTLVEKYGLNKLIELLPPMTYSESMRFLSICNMSLIVEAICEEGIYLPTKFVDAIQTSLPVFCVSPSDGTLKDMVEKYKVGYVCDNTSVSSVEESLRCLIKDIRSNKVPKITNGIPSYFFEKDIVKLFDSFIK